MKEPIEIKERSGAKKPEKPEKLEKPEKTESAEKPKQGKKTQAQTNPFPYSDSNKRYYTYDYYLRREWGGKVAKIPLDCGLSCPNISRGKGCIYCSGRGSGDSVPEGLTLRQQYDAGRQALSSKWDTTRCIAYLQAHTNTYAPAERLEKIYNEVLSFPGVEGLNIATRADCLPVEVCELLRRVSEKTRLTVELGLQSSDDVTAELINRGHTFGEFTEGYHRLRQMVPDCEICVHIILGLPGEDEGKMMKTVADTAALRPDQVKIHLLHVLRGTAMGEMYERGEYEPLTMEHYVELVGKALTMLPAKTVIGRVTGDGLADDLLAPLWSRKKTCVINDIDKFMFKNNIWQGSAR